MYVTDCLFENIKELIQLICVRTTQMMNCI